MVLSQTFDTGKLDCIPKRSDCSWGWPRVIISKFISTWNDFATHLHHTIYGFGHVQMCGVSTVCIRGFWCCYELFVPRQYQLNIFISSQLMLFVNLLTWNLKILLVHIIHSSRRSLISNYAACKRRVHTPAPCNDRTRLWWFHRRT